MSDIPILGGGPIGRGTGDSWYSDIDYPGVRTDCGKHGCDAKATRVGFASPSHRVICCDEHEDELTAIRQMAKAHGPITDKHPPSITVTWRRDNRFLK